MAALHVYGRCNTACSWGVGVTPSPVPAWLLEQQGCGVRGGQAVGVGQVWGTAQLGLLQFQGAWDGDIAYTLMCYPSLLRSEGSSTR